MSAGVDRRRTCCEVRTSTPSFRTAWWSARYRTSQAQPSTLCLHAMTWK